MVSMCSKLEFKVESRVSYEIWRCLDRIIKTELFRVTMRKTGGHSAPGADAYARWFGATIPKTMPESSAWWKNQQKDLFAMTEEGENGMMQAMARRLNCLRFCASYVYLLFWRPSV